MSERNRRGRFAACAAYLGAGLLAGAAPALAQDSEAADPPPPGNFEPLDPSAPLAPMPDLGVDWPEVADDPNVEEAAGSQPQSLRVLPYSVRISGLSGLASGEEISAAFDAASALRQDKEQRANAAQLELRSQADADLLRELLRSHGYYAASVAANIEGGTDARALSVDLSVSAGALYRFDSVTLFGIDAAGADAGRLRAAFGLAEGDPVDAAKVIEAEANLIEALGNEGYAAAELGEPAIVIDHAATQASYTLRVDPGPRANFGAIRVTGSPPFSPNHVGTIARFDSGDVFDRSKVEDLRQALVATGLIASVNVESVPSADGQTVDLEVALTPAPPRTISGELGYGTGEGFRAEASWQHRNFINPEGALTLSAVVGTQEQGASAQLRRSNWKRRDQVATLLGAVSNIERAAYAARTAQLGAYVERQSSFIFQKDWTYSLGTEILYSDEQDTIPSTGEERRRAFKIAALPASLGFDGSNDLLDPTRGFRLLGRLSPEFSLQDGASGYVKTQIDGSVYLPVKANIVGAARVRLGSIIGAERDDIAPSRRFYAGGGGSVRGYGYQKVGPLDAEGEPIGGKSLAEIAVEARVRFGNFGVVPFVDGGMVSKGKLPRLADFQFGAGLGLRYYSSFGPIRVDVGTPLDRREGDSRIAVTVSLGQAF